MPERSVTVTDALPEEPEPDRCAAEMSACRFAALAVVAGLIGGAAAAQQATGRLETHVLFDSSFQRPRRVWVYTPPGYDSRRPAPYPLIVAFDGVEYRDTMPLPLILDTLLAAGQAPAFVAVLIDDSSAAVRIAELGNSTRMADFLGRQLVPWVRRGWHVTADPHRVIVTGSSAGGLGAAFVALARPDLFGNVWSQSGAFWRGAEGSNAAPWEWLTQHVAASPRKDVRFFLDVGELEDHPTLGGSGPNFRDASRRFHDALQAKGYDVTYTEVPGGNHAPQWWRLRLPLGIVALSAGWPRP
jgi:enterochelin esterase family protein